MPRAVASLFDISRILQKEGAVSPPSLPSHNLPDLAPKSNLAFCRAFFFEKEQKKGGSVATPVDATAEARTLLGSGFHP